MQATGLGSSACGNLELKSTHIKGTISYLSVISICTEQNAPWPLVCRRGTETVTERNRVDLVIESSVMSILS